MLVCHFSFVLHFFLSYNALYRQVKHNCPKVFNAAPW